MSSTDSSFKTAMRAHKRMASVFVGLKVVLNLRQECLNQDLTRVVIDDEE
jgi:hypothetical protein